MITFDSSEYRGRLLAESGNVFVDIGAGRGFYSVNLAKSFRHVIAFEANPYNALEIIKLKLTLGIDNLSVVNAAVCNYTGMVKLRVNGWDVGSIKDRPYLHNEILVPCVKLTEVLPLNNSYSLIKIDIEGAEDIIIDDVLALNPAKLCIECHDTFNTIIQKLLNYNTTVLPGVSQHFNDLRYIIAVRR